MTPRLNLQWQRELRVTELQPLHILSSICSKVVLLYDQTNRRRWNFDTTGDYTVKFECITICKILFPSVSSTSSLLWKGLVYPKIEAFLWQLMHEKLCTREFLAYKHIISHQQMTCPYCDYKIESYSHLFLYCLEPWKLWSRFMIGLGSSGACEIQLIMSCSGGII